MASADSQGRRIDDSCFSALPDLPVFLTLAEYVEAPLEATYTAAFDAVPDYWRNVLDTVAAKPRRRRPHNR